MVNRLWALISTDHGEIAGIPPSFADAPLTYGFALLADLLATSICLSVLLRIAFEGRRMIKAETLAHSTVPRRKRFGTTLLSTYRSVLAGFLVVIILRAAPDALWMLALDEVSRPVLATLFRIDYSADFAALGVLIWTVVLWAWTRQSTTQQLYQAADIPMPALGWNAIREAIKITGIVSLVCIGITIGKAGA